MVRGFIDEISQDSIRGWAHDPQAPGPVRVAVLLGGERLAETVANIHRRDLAGTVTEDGCCAFEVRLPRSLTPAEVPSVSVVAGKVTLQLSAGARVMPLPSGGAGGARADDKALAGRGTATPPRTAGFSGADDRYDMRLPLAANALDIFKDQWSGSLPGLGDHRLPAFHNDVRIDYFERAGGGFAGKRILELGPLEGSHTFMLHARAASEIVAIEANVSAFLKCLIVKNLYGLDRARFVLGDFSLYLQQRHRFDLILASGVLYHMSDPLGLIRGMAAAADTICLWTHYFDAEIIAARADLAPRFAPPETVDFDGLAVTMSEQSYPQEALAWGGFCGGAMRHTKWLSRPSLIAAFERLGFEVDIGEDERAHPNGPALWMVARRRWGS